MGTVGARLMVEGMIGPLVPPLILLISKLVSAWATRPKGDRWVCSSCGARVRADAKTCPACGGVFSSGTESVLVRIPLTADPAEIAAITARLDAEGIPYAVVDESLEEPGREEKKSPLLVVLSDYAEHIWVLLGEYHQGVAWEPSPADMFPAEDAPVAVPAPGPPPADAPLVSTRPRLRPPPEGVYGWLLLLCLDMVVFAPSAYFAWVNATAAKGHEAGLRGLADASVSMILLMVIGAVAIGWGMVVGLRLWRVIPGAIASAKAYFNLLAVVIGLGAMIVYVGVASGDLLPGPFGILGTADILAKALFGRIYLEKSLRVRATYMEYWRLAGSMFGGG